MNAAQKIAKLESLLETINQNRTPSPVSSGLAAVPSATVTSGASPAVAAAASPTPVPAPEAPVSAIIEPRVKAHKPTPVTPMEQAMAVSDEFEIREPSDPELEISFPDDDDPVLTFDSEPPPADEPVLELATEPPPPLTPDAPTAPVYTRSPETAEPRRIETATAQPSTPIAKVVSRAEPRTFGELLDRALALRPR